jgi:hypothetical protein
MRKLMKVVMGMVVCLGVGGLAFAAWTVDGSGFGFVGKGDVQAVYGWSNKQLQNNEPNVQFRTSTTSITEHTWTCDRDDGPQTQERTWTLTTTTQGLIDSTARLKNQITGFNLNGFSGDPVTDTETDGPALGSCPVGWTAIDMVAEEPVVLGSGVEVSINGSDWFELE